ncbi:hypothetical protein EYF80_063919 [Liparis tanakae]|uniref:Uncharacterized protein n=1 Tax=Liparis tanakae TaxID=230148 RepID=A0A4Z2EB21_9TELE|nr:hypothetical protein EYF80_063919 [Liparis tanakae]
MMDSNSGENKTKHSSCCQRAAAGHHRTRSRCERGAPERRAAIMPLLLEVKDSIHHRNVPVAFDWGWRCCLPRDFPIQRAMSGAKRSPLYLEQREAPPVTRHRAGRMGEDSARNQAPEWQQVINMIV